MRARRLPGKLSRLYRYVNTPGDLQRFASCLHLLPAAYSAIVVEDINGVVRADDRNMLVRTLALLLEGVRAYRVSSGCGARCPLLVTDSSDEARRPRYIYDRWLPAAVLLSPSTLPTGPDGCFTLTLASPSVPSSSATTGQSAGADARPSAAPPPDSREAAAASTRSAFRCWYRAAGGRLVLEAVQGPDGPDAQALPYDGAARGPARGAAGFQGAMAID
ncbi:hypothetical protein PLESTM_001594100 [Pleodorina starrii]|nr:hypothetical protein PLESTM_001594100 [Pleodorina starrii]